MNHFSAKSLLTLSLLISIFAFNACQKDGIQVADANVQSSANLPSADRSPVMYGVTMFAPNNRPSLLVKLDAGSGAVLNAPGLQPFVVSPNGQNIILVDLKGVCWVNGLLFVTTGTNNVDVYDNKLMQINPATGQCTLISSSTIGTVSDIEYDGSNTIYGLRNNSNVLVTITNNGNNWGTYAAVGPINNLAAGYVAKGLSIVNFEGNSLVVAATSTLITDKAKLYDVPFTAGGATLAAEINPLQELSTGHCGIGYNFVTGSMVITRSPNVTVSGLNSFFWSPPFPNPANSFYWGANTFYFEDLSTSL